MSAVLTQPEILKYLRHLSGCAKSLRLTGNPVCTCGLDALLKALEFGP